MTRCRCCLLLLASFAMSISVLAADICQNSNEDSEVILLQVAAGTSSPRKSLKNHVKSKLTAVQRGLLSCVSFFAASPSVNTISNFIITILICFVFASLLYVFCGKSTSAEPVRAFARAISPDFESELEANTSLPNMTPFPGKPGKSDDAFGETGCWACSAALPESGYLFPAMESPFAKRDWTILPQRLAADVLSELLLESGVWASTSKGFKGKHDRTLGQDNFCISRLGFGWEVFCVFDGHGLDGHWPATRAARRIASFLQQSACSGYLKDGKVEAALKHAFDAVQTDLEAASIKQGINLQNCGTSATVILRNRTNEHREFLWVAVVGDSRAILFHPTKGLVEETTDHTPEIESEAARIKEMGGEIEVTEDEDGYISRRVNVKGKKFPGLGITRALGDGVVKNCGVVSEPEIVKWSAKDNEGAYLLTCSDGVWEFIDSKRVVEFFVAKDLEKTGPREALEHLLKEARHAWHVHEGGDYTDDITMVLLPISGSPLAGYDTKV